jgi:phosphoribosylamine--glycine ligase
MERKMRILVIGNGGREHALVWKLAQSPRVEKLFCAPGNAGCARHAELINLKPGDLDGLANFAEAQRVDLTVVGPEAPLIAGIVDRFEARGLRIFGPATDPARLEGSKVFSKELMTAQGIPTAQWGVFEDADAAHAYVSDYFGVHGPGARLVVKADGIAAGKGVVVGQGADACHAAVTQMMRDRVFGSAGDRVVIEECLEGPEISVMAFTDGQTVRMMPAVQDHKRAGNDDTGPNTGGMGAYSPVPAASGAVLEEALHRVLLPAVRAIGSLGIPYKGVLYAGLMLTSEGVKTLEFNCRFGDPETQVVLPLLETDLVDVLNAVVDCTLDEQALVWSSKAAVTVVGASGGYPGAYTAGYAIEGLDAAAGMEGCLVFQAGTKLDDGRVVTDGGRVLSVTGVGDDLAMAVSRAYAGMSHIRFEGMHYRTDIAAKASAVVG